jgi:hypothetical protein
MYSINMVFKKKVLRNLHFCGKFVRNCEHVEFSAPFFVELVLVFYRLRKNFAKIPTKFNLQAHFYFFSRRFPGDEFSGLCRNCHIFVSISQILWHFKQIFFVYTKLKEKSLLFNAKTLFLSDSSFYSALPSRHF